MPHLKQEDRRYYEIDQSPGARTPAELNYLITRLCIRYLLESNPVLSYEAFNAVVGALRCASAEFEHQALRLYEDLAATRNGNVYDVLRQEIARDNYRKLRPVRDIQQGPYGHGQIDVLPQGSLVACEEECPQCAQYVASPEGETDG